MNGEEKKLAVELWELWVKKHDEAAKEVRSNIKDIKSLLMGLNCKTHQERMRWMMWGINGSYLFTVLVLVWLLRLIMSLH